MGVEISRDSFVWGYLRVSTDDQNLKSQKLAILEWANENDLSVHHWIEVKSSSRKSTKMRKIDELLDQVSAGDTIITTELSRMGRSVGQIAILMDRLIGLGVKLVSLKEDIRLNGSMNIQSKMMVTMVSLFAEIERDLISERTKEGLARAKADGKVLGRPKGKLGTSKLDPHQDLIKQYLKQKVSKASLAKIFGCSWTAMNAFIKSRGLESG